MSALRDMLGWEVRTGDPVTVHGITVRPQSRVLRVDWRRGGFVWNRPAGLLVDWGDREERIPIYDVTRLARRAVLGSAVVFFLLSMCWTIRDRRDRDE